MTAAVTSAHQLRPLNSALARKAAAELNERPSETPYYLEALRTWAEQQQHFRAPINDQFLIVFLRASKFSLERAKQKLEDFCVYRTLLPELFINRKLNDPKMVKIFKDQGTLWLPQPVADDGPRVLMIRPQCFRMNDYSMQDIFKAGAMAIDSMLMIDDNAVVAGYVFLFDLGKIPTQILMSFDPLFIRKLTILLNKANPSRMKGFHFLNMQSFFEKMFNLVTSAINAKLRNRFYVHDNDLESLYKYIPRHILPKEYGGDQDMAEICEIMLQKIAENAEIVRKQEENFRHTEMRCKEHKSKLDAMFEESQFGVEGSFRKLNID